MERSPFPPLPLYVKGPSQKWLDPVAASPSSFVKDSWIEGWGGEPLGTPCPVSRRRSDNPASCLRLGFWELEISLNLRED